MGNEAKIRSESEAYSAIVTLEALRNRQSRNKNASEKTSLIRLPKRLFAYTAFVDHDMYK